MICSVHLIGYVMLYVKCHDYLKQCIIRYGSPGGKRCQPYLLHLCFPYNATLISPLCSVWAIMSLPMSFSGLLVIPSLVYVFYAAMYTLGKEFGCSGRKRNWLTKVIMTRFLEQLQTIYQSINPAGWHSDLRNIGTLRITLTHMQFLYEFSEVQVTSPHIQYTQHLHILYIHGQVCHVRPSSRS